jgi:hypothetical protein
VKEALVHRLWHGLAWAGLMALAFSILALGQASPWPASLAADYQLLTNSDFEVYDPPYGQFDGVNCQVATGWHRFWYDGPPPCWMDARVFANSHLGVGWLEKRQGETSQLIVGTEPYTAGVWQRVTGLTPGLGYGFRTAMLTIYQTSAPPAVDGMMMKQVGIDPTGGTDPRAATVVWSEPDGHDEGPWTADPRTAVYAQGPAMTVFIRITSPYAAGPSPFLNLSFMDWAILAQTPIVAATSPAVSAVPTFAVSWGNAVAAPGGEVVKYDVQWLDEAEGVWHDWLVRTGSVQATFVGEQCHAYRFRARALQRYEDDSRLYSPYRPDGDTRTLVQGAKLIGRVLSPEEILLGGATVAISGTAYATTSGSGGAYELDTPCWTEPQTVTVDHPAWLPPAPVYGADLGPMETMAFTWTLRPRDDAVVNGGFEAGLDGWSVLGDPALVGDPVHTGRGALALGMVGTLGMPGVLSSTVPASLTAGVSQTLVVTDAWEPVLSFWYRPSTPNSAGLLSVTLTVVTRTVSSTLPVTTSQVFTPPLDAEGWSHRWYDVGLPEAALTGTVTIRFQVRQQGGAATTAVYLDEVNLGATLGGPYKVYLPLALKQF